MYNYQYSRKKMYAFYIKVMELKQMLDNEGFRWYFISGRTE